MRLAHQPYSIERIRVIRAAAIRLTPACADESSTRRDIAPPRQYCGIFAIFAAMRRASSRD